MKSLIIYLSRADEIVDSLSDVKKAFPMGEGAPAGGG